MAEKIEKTTIIDRVSSLISREGISGSQRQELINLAKSLKKSEERDLYFEDYSCKKVEP